MAESKHKTTVELSVLDRATRTLQRIRGEVGKVTAAGARMAGGIGSAAAGAARGGLSLFLGGLRASLNLTRLLAIATLGLSVSLGVVGTRFTSSAVAMAAHRQATQQGLTNILGSARAAKQAMAELQDIARGPGIGLEEALAGFSQLAAVGVDTRTATALIREFGNAVALAAGGPAELGLALRGLSQMMGKGKVSAEELNQQILEQAPILRRAIQAAWGTADSEQIARKLERDGLSVQDFWARTLVSMRKLPRAGDGAQNALQNVGIAWDELKIAFGTGFLGADASERLGGLTGWLERMAPAAERAGAAMRVAFDAILARVPPAVAWIQGLVRQLSEVGVKASLLEKWGQLKLEFPWLATLEEHVRGTIAAVADILKEVDWKTLGSASRMMLVGLAEGLKALAPVAKDVAAAIVVLINAVSKWVETHPQLAGMLVVGGGLNKLLGGVPGQAASGMIQGLGNIGGGAGWPIVLPALLSAGSLLNALGTRPPPGPAPVIGGGVAAGAQVSVKFGLDGPTLAALDARQRAIWERHFRAAMRECAAAPA